MKLQTKINIGLLAIIAGLVIYTAISKRHLKNLNEKAKAENVILRNQNNSLNGQVLVYKDKAGRMQSQFEASEGTINTLKNSLSLLEIDRKQLRKQVGNLNNLLFVAQSTIEAHGEGQTKIIYIDTTKQIDTLKTAYFNFEDSLINLHGGLMRNDLLNLNYEIKPITLNYVSYTRDPLFGNPVTVMDIHTSPQVNVINANAFTVKHKEPFYEVWWVDVLAGLVGGYLLFK